MSERFFMPVSVSGSTAILSGEEARHAVAVMRVKAGDRVTLFDGGGAEYESEIVAVHKHTLELAIVERREISRELPIELTLAIALPKGDRQKWLVEKATELGVSRLVPLITQRGVAQPVESALERLRRRVFVACKQCGRNRLLEISPPQQAIDFFTRQQGVPTRWIGDAEGDRLSAPLPPIAGAIVAAVGPEGGFSPTEQDAAQAAGWQRVSLGKRVLRVETAAIALAAVVAASYPD
jgi:16S rRNA (uracil1498-N3)-methyltransferase